MVAKFGTNTSDATFKLIFVRKIIQVRELLQYQALPKSWHAQKGGGGGYPCQDFSGGFEKVYKGQLK